MQAMKRSKLELYEDILSALSEKALTLDDIAYECKTNLIFLRSHLVFMAEHGLIEEKCTRKIRFYGLTRRGETVHKTMAVARHLEKLKPKASLAVTLEAIPKFAQEPRNTQRRN